MYVPGEGPADARVMFVGEAPGATEDQSGRPFSGRSGDEFTAEIHEAGFVRRDCYVTNVVKMRPPGNDIGEYFARTKTIAVEEGLPKVWGCYPREVVKWGIVDLYEEINDVKPSLIVCLGNTALWAITGRGDIGDDGTPSGITKWRGSVQLSRSFGDAGRIKTVCTYHPALIVRQWEWRNIAVHDLKRAFKESHYPEVRLPQWRFIVRPTPEHTHGVLDLLLNRAANGPLPLVCDIETRAQSYISCIGLAWSRLDAICIPLLGDVPGAGYYLLDDEVAILQKLRALLMHPNTQLIGQNFHYDVQYFAKEFGYAPPVAFDTMTAQHVLFSGMPKALHFSASMYNEHYCFWKDDGKDWDPKTMPMEDHWIYNCRDCTETFEVYETQNRLLDEMGLRPQFDFLHGKMFKPVLRLMLRGVKQDRKVRAQMMGHCLDGMAEREQYLVTELGHAVNPRSPKQLSELFYEDFAQKPVLHKSTKRPTCDDAAMHVIGEREPLLRDICDAIAEYRAIGQTVGVLKAGVDPDDRLRCSYSTSLVETYRLSSKKNAFGGGTNMQNISTGERKRGKAAELPNMKKAFIPDTGMIIAEIDLAGADAQVVASEANCQKMKEVFRAGIKIHTVTAKEVYGHAAGPDGTKEPLYTYAKAGGHLSNYGGKPPTLSKTMGITVHAASQFQKRYFEVYPEILEWHREVEAKLQATRMLENKFGFRRQYFGRIDSLLTEGLAWVPQSTVAILINKIWVALNEQCPWVEVLMQVHDSLVFQFGAAHRSQLWQVRDAAQVVIPYDDPLIIPVELKSSSISWGDCKKTDWT